ncbi:phage shock envelope stress response protein PspM [Actinoalloteichus hymeniacidonis]|uniref:Uncharacterized protein n=1 Tax=Actinoalloteichus hymeniacidonis TaxID=340345 RepID=A0AAC9HNR1_9PSEU|nr:hypothetical protein [Actinoalloteichus hymeniacidonis]AOS62695.1 hypothetical protein TL08_09400 [Actinoalloteichus hymeniacidonis]MBB5909274.1 hypothetical protein [Actinoalloteichus hymeniacidonis]
MAGDKPDWAKHAASIGKFGSELAGEVSRGVSTWRDPRAKAERKRKRAKRGLKLRIGLAAIAGTAAFFVADGPEIEFPEIALGGIAVVSSVSAVSSGIRVQKLYRTPLPAASVPPPELPPVSSAARAPMQRLIAAESSLGELLDRLGEPTKGAASVPLDVVVQTRLTAVDAASAVRDGADRLQAVERAAQAAPATERASLSSEIRRLERQLDESVDGYGRLVAEAGRAVAASASAEPQTALTDASDRLAGLASALRELSRGVER